MNALQDVRQRSGISRGRGEAGTSETYPAHVPAGAGYAQVARGLLALARVSLATARICCKFWNCHGYAGAGGLDWITAPPRAFRIPWLPLPRPAQSKPALPRSAPLLGIHAGAGLLALLCPSGWAGAGLLALAVLTVPAVLALACWPCCFAGAGCTVAPKGEGEPPSPSEGNEGN